MKKDMPIVDFEFSFSYEGETLPTFQTVSGKVERGSCIVLYGESGCGKSTLLRGINHLIPQFYEGDLKGYCHINGQQA